MRTRAIWSTAVLLYQLGITPTISEDLVTMVPLYLRVVLGGRHA